MQKMLLQSRLRAIQAHFIVDSVLNSMLISTSLTDESSHSSSQIGETNTEENNESSHSSSQFGETLKRMMNPVTLIHSLAKQTLKRMNY